MQSPPPATYGTDPLDLPARPAPAGAAFDVLGCAIDLCGALVTIGPLANLAVLKAIRPGALARASVVTMGGWGHRPRRGCRSGEPARDGNIQWDTHTAATVVAAPGHLTLVTLSPPRSPPGSPGATCPGCAARARWATSWRGRRGLAPSMPICPPWAVTTRVRPMTSSTSPMAR
ncbi:hypothetical protein DEH69_23125 [Streptomyces sp. PT12]|nr:hypothetical protein DEH69_23125 [Streptomyces sp. PT12]